MRPFRWLIGSILIGVIAAFGIWFGYAKFSDSRAQIVPLDQVPEPLVNKARATLPEVKFDHARKLANGNFEVRGKARNGKVREVEMRPSGDVVEIE